jgi:hypothetical protein
MKKIDFTNPIEKQIEALLRERGLRAIDAEYIMSLIRDYAEGGTGYENIDSN